MLTNTSYSIYKLVHRTKLFRENVHNHVIKRGPKNLNTPPFTSFKVPTNTGTLLKPSSSSFSSKRLVTATKTTTMTSSAPAPTSPAIKTVLNDVPIFGRVFSSSTKQSQVYHAERSFIKTENQVNTAKEETFAKIKAVTLIDDSLQNPKKMPIYTPLEKEKITGVSLVQKTMADAMNVQPSNTLRDFCQSVVCLFGSVVGETNSKEHAFLGHITSRNSDGSYVLEGLCFTSSPINPVLQNGSTIMAPNIIIGDHQLLTGLEGKNIQCGFFSISHLAFGAKPIAFKYLHQNTLEKGICLIIEKYYYKNYVSPHVTQINIENLVWKHKTNLLLENNISGMKIMEIVIFK